MQYFYSEQVDGDKILLSQDEVGHLRKSLRKSVGQPIRVLNGRGDIYDCVLVELKADQGVAQIVDRQEAPPEPYHLHIGIAPTKNHSRMEWFMEKATEIGVSKVSIIQTERSERPRVNEGRLRRIMIAALKQSGRAHLPALQTGVSLEKVLSQENGATEKYIAHCSRIGMPHLAGQLTAASSYLVLIGPEGDFSRREITSALERDFREISLGNARLRTETAGVYVCSMINSANQASC